MTEFLLVIAIPFAWGIWELIALSRARPTPAAEPPAVYAPQDAS